ncbi:hypothetical protein VP1G_07706 [Cytospora mali]|uniref:Acetylserotonin methytransferase-like protein n=1 Tax=Cytospora mali TaxID=578113 RepID=A0A194V9J7_CYTMA|nr:hypothetical protein VP1G_07706 [Valsa mali var. pyri (nom. inval.)]
MTTGPSQPGGSTFSLFPKERPPSRTQNNTPGRPSIDSMSRDSPPRAGRRTPLERKISIRDGKKPAPAAVGPAGSSSMAVPESTDADERRVTAWPSDRGHPDNPIIQRPAPVATTDPAHRSWTAFSEAQTLARTNSNRSRSSIAKPPLENQAPPERSGEASTGGPLRSIFPEYDPNLPLSQQNYYPPQSSPTHPAGIPAGAISRHLYSPTSEAAPAADTSNNNNNDNPASPLRSPLSVHSSRTTQQQPATTRKWPPPRVNVKPSTPETSTTEQLRDFWKVANGWKAPASEGRVYTFKIASERDAPVYTLSSKTQPFYRLRLDPTSASAYVSLSRFDPSRPYKPPVPPKDGGPGGPGGSGEGGGSSGGGEQSTKGWNEVISTTLEESTRHHAPQDGLVALLYPSAAAKLAVDSRFTNPTAFATAERECARLVWDDDSSSHFLVHPALAMPFCVTVERNPTWSRTEYTLEHIESPQHLARLTRDGTGMGWLEVDTGIASKIDAVYLADVAVAALMLVAHADGEFSRVEVFEPPPSIRSDSKQEKRASRISKLSARVGSGDKKEKKAGKTRMEEFELDLESQMSDLKKHPRKDKDDEKMPGCARAIISLITVTFKCLIWCATILFKALTGCIGLLAKCLTSEKL